MFLPVVLAAIHLGVSPTVSPDGGSFAFSWADRIYVAPTTGGVARAVTGAGFHDDRPVFSRDGRTLYFQSDRLHFGKVFTVPAAGGAEPRLFSPYADWMEPLAELPDGRLLAHAMTDEDDPEHSKRAVTVGSGEPAPKTLLHLELYDPALLPGGDVLLFRWRPDVQRYRRHRTKYSLSGEIWSYDFRTRDFRCMVADGFDSWLPRPAPDGTGFYFISTRGGFVRNLYYRSLAGGEPVALTAFTEHEVDGYAVSADGRTIVAQVGPDFWRVDPGRRAAPVKLALEEKDALPRPHRAKFREGLLAAWKRMGEVVCDPAMGGCDWEAVRGRYLPLAEDAPTLTDFSRCLTLMLAELDLSHTGFTPDRSRREYDPGTPDPTSAQQAELDRIKAKRKENYRAKIAKRRERVHAVTGGKTGYIHISTMFEAGWQPYVEDLKSEARGRERLILDVRGNTGGFIADRILKTLYPAPVYATARTRKGPVDYPYDKPWGYFPGPVVVLIDELSGSNAEIFAHAVKTLKRGPLVGRPTQGNVIVAPSEPLGELGKIVIPETDVYTVEGVNMEGNAAVPDYEVGLGPGDLFAGRDPQLEKAIAVVGREK